MVLSSHYLNCVGSLQFFVELLRQTMFTYSCLNGQHLTSHNQYCETIYSLTMHRLAFVKAFEQQCYLLVLLAHPHSLVTSYLPDTAFAALATLLCYSRYKTSRCPHQSPVIAWQIRTSHLPIAVVTHRGSVHAYTCLIAASVCRS